MNKLQYKKKILIFLCTLDLGGAERQAIYLANFLKNTGYEVLIIGFGKGNGDAISLINEYKLQYKIISFNLNSKGIALLFQLVLLALKLRFLKPDLLISYTYWPNVVINTIWKLTGAKNSIWNQRDGGYGFGNFSFESFAYNNASEIVSNSTSGKYSLLKHFHKTKREIKIIFNGVNNAIDTSNQEITRKLYSISQDAFVCLMIANFTNIKDHITLVEAWNIFQKKINNESMLIMVGRHDVTYEQTLKKVKELKLENSIKILDFTDDIQPLIKVADLCVFSSSQNEGVPNGVLECMAQSLPVVATDIMGAKDALGDDYEFLVPEKSPEIFADKIEEFARDKELRRQIGNKLKIRIDKHFSLESMYNNYTQLLNSIFKNEE